MSQSLSNILLHVVFSTKNRRAFIDHEIETQLHSYIASISASRGSYLHIINGIEDHIHLLVTLPRTVTISDLLEEIKKNSSKWIKTKGLKYQDFSWQKGFGAFSVSFSQYDIVLKYISNQKKHHKTHSFEDEYRKLLQLHNVSYDEKYVWD